MFIKLFRQPTMAATLYLTLSACGSGSGNYGLDGKNPDTATVAAVDRFSDTAGFLFKRSGPAYDPNTTKAIIPAANAAYALDLFTVHALGGDGNKVVYYSLDVTSPTPQTAFKIVDRQGNSIAGQLPILSKLPGDTGYSDFARITEVAVGSGYVANSIASSADVATASAAGATQTMTSTVVNWSVVPQGTTASLTFLGKNPLGNKAWIDGKVVNYAEFETNVTPTAAGTVPLVPIYVTFKEDALGPASGFMTEAGGVQTHNVVALVPGQTNYTSLWDHYVVKNADFASVTNAQTAAAKGTHLTPPFLVNCPVVQ